MVCSNATCVALAKPGRPFCAIHDALYRRVERADIAAGRICWRCRHKLTKGQWVQTTDEGLVHARACEATETEL
jgi:hypothetical protein